MQAKVLSRATFLVAIIAILVLGASVISAAPTGTIEICVGLQAPRQTGWDEPIEWELRGGASVLTGMGDAVISGAPSQVGCFEVAGYPVGPSYDLYVKGPDHLGELITSATLGGPLPATGNPIDVSPTVTLIDGDADDDNLITSFDFSILVSSLTFPPNPASVEPRADFDEDGSITSFDLSVLIADLTFPPTQGDS